MEEQNKSDALTDASAEKKQSIKNFIKNLKKNTESGNEYYKALCDVIDSEGVESQIKVKKKKISKKDEQKLSRINKKREKKGLEPVDMIYVKRTGFRVFICFLFLCFLIGMGGVTILAKWMSQAPDIDLTKFEHNDATVVYDTNGDEYQALQSREMREPIEIEEVPELVQLAFISIEDQRFYSHFGVDIRGTMKAVVNVLTSGSTDGPGGSTITQQLIKLTHLSSETSIKRKVMEWYLSVKLENTIEKREILEAYLNKVNMSDTWGIESAAQHYFGVSSNQLSVAQAAVLASIINSPAFYNPYNYLLDDEGSYYIEKTVLEDGSILYGYNPENQARALEVVAKMYELGYIRQTEYLVAKDELENNKIGLIKPQFLSTYSYFTDAVYQQVVSDLMEEYGYSEDDATDMVLNGGLNIYSTVDPVIQTTMEKYAQDSSIFPSQSSTAKEASKILSEINGEETNLIPQVGSAVIEIGRAHV